MIRSVHPFWRAHSLVQIGYPPPDTHLRSWLISGVISDDTLGTIRKRLYGFVYALLIVTRRTLEAIDSVSGKSKIPKTEGQVTLRQAELAFAFRERMTEGQSYQGANTFRKGFYKEVTDLADEVRFRAFLHFGEDDSFPKFLKDIRHTNDPSYTKEPEELHPYVSKDGDGIENAGDLLAQFVDPGKLLDHDGERPRRPLVIFAFDEAHVLTDYPQITSTSRATNWNLFSELRRVLKQTSDHAIFYLFLSTAGRFHLFSPETSSDSSMLIQNLTLSTLDPITEISFDDLAYAAPEYKVMLEQVVGIDWMCHLGRPLYSLFGNYFSEQLTYHLEQIRVHLRRRGDTVQI